jgi:hypothetical protein
VSNEQKIQILKDKRDLINNVSPCFCTAKWLQTTLYLQNGYNHSCHHPAPHKIPLEEVLANPSALHNSKFKKEQRANMLDGVRPKECSYCWNIEDLDTQYFSDRHYKTADYWAWDRFEEIAKSNPSDNVTPNYLEVSFSNVCNFKCSYCSPEISSQWLAEINQHGPYPTNRGSHDIAWLKQTERYPYKHSEPNPYLDAFWKWFPDILTSLKVFRITGGEPLLSKDTWRVLDYIIERNPPPMQIAINSNLCVEDEFIDRLIVKVNQLKELGHDVKVFTSLESIGARAEYSRYGIDYKLWCDNLHKMLANTEAVIAVMTTINILSISNFVPLIELIMEYRAKYNKAFDFNRIPLSINYLSWPPYLSISLLSQDLKDKFSEEILTCAKEWLMQTDESWRPAKVYLEEWDQIKRLCDYLKTSRVDLAAREDFVAFIKEYDIRRNTNFEQTFPEYATLVQQW